MPPEPAPVAAWQAFVFGESAARPALGRVTALAADLFDAPVAAIALMDGTAIRLASSIGLAGDEASWLERLCGEALALCEDGVFVAEDAAQDRRLPAAAAAPGQPGFGFYAGAALVAQDNQPFGMLCVADRQSRPWPGGRALGRLRTLAVLALDDYELRFAHHESESARRMLALAEAVAHIGHWRYDLRSRHLVWSDGIYRMHGVTRDSHRPDPASTLAFCHPEERAALEAELRSALRQKRSYSFERRLVRPDGAVRRVISRGGCECDVAGRVTALFGVLQDVTEQAATLVAWRDSEARYRLLVDQATDIVLSLENSGRITLVSPSVTAILGYQADEVLGRRPIDFLHIKDRRKLRHAYLALLRGPQPQSPKPVEFQARHKAGRWVWLESHPALAQGPALAGRPGFIDIIRDISLRKAQQAEIAAAHRAAEAAARAKSDLLADVSHEIRTPLTAILGFAHLFEHSAGLTPQQSHTLVGINAAARGLLNLANDILHLAKLEAGQVRLDRRPFSPLDVVRDAVALLQPEADRKGLRLVVDSHGERVAPLIGDPDRIHQILLNLVSNAIKFTAEGEVRIGLALTPAGGAVRLTIAVQDSGIGIAADQLQRLFRPYVQAEAAAAAGFGGTGLGLAISKRLAEAMHGSLTAESRIEVGSCFVLDLTLPRAETVSAEADAPSGPDLAGMLHGLRLLAAEDVAVNRRLLRVLLDPLGCMVDMVEDGAEAVAAVQSGRYALVLMDMRMPVLDGIAATQRIRALGGAYLDLPIVALTANAYPEELQRCRAAGMDDYLVKPFSARDLTAMVIKWVLMRRQGRTAARDDDDFSLAAS